MRNPNGQRVTDTDMSGGNKYLNRKTVKLMALASAGAIVLLLLCLYFCFCPFLPSWVSWDDGSFCDRTGVYETVLKNRKVTVKNDTGVIWSSPENVMVQKALSCDVDNDHMDELVLLCWRKGQYGAHKPFWVEKNDNGWSQHLFVYEYASDTVQPKWMSSYIGQDVMDIVSNGKEAPDTRLWFEAPGHEMSSWVWDSWGFTREDTEISFAVFGDILAHEPVYRYGLQHDAAFTFLFENVQDIISDSDVAVINQETPLTDSPEQFSDYPRFGTPVNIGQAVVDAGFHVVTCATNHALDRGAVGVNFTKNFFEKNHVRCLGIQTTEERDEKPYEVIRRNGVSFALFNYTYGTNGIPLPDDSPDMVSLLSDEETIQGDIAEAKSVADFVIVFVHWGTEYADEPDAFQQKWTQIFLDSEVDIVVGTHPHTLQPFELCTGSNGHRMLVYYSIGNYISAQPEKSCVKGGIAQFTISLTPQGYQLAAYDLQPLEITWHQGGKYTAEPKYDS